MKKKFALFAFLLGWLGTASAQLVMQGAIQNSLGAPVPNGNYNITFRLYETETGGTPVWSETQVGVPVSGGLYTVSLGAANPLTVPFDKIYYVGVAVSGGSEMIPRSQLSYTPYAMSLRGKENMFPGAGPVGIGTVAPDQDTDIHLKDTDSNSRILIEGDNGAVLRFKKGNNTADITYNGSSISSTAALSLSATFDDGLNLPAGSAVNYPGLSGWLLVDKDYFETDNDNWICVDSWNNNVARTLQRFTPNTPFSQEYILRPNQSGDDILKKNFDLTGIPHSRIKVVFTYHFFDSWDSNQAEAGWAAFASKADLSKTQDGSLQVGWVHYQPTGFRMGEGLGYVNFSGANDIADSNITGEMIAQHSENNFWILFGSTLNEDASSESFGISNIEIWVK